jgi:hypothetical protein
LDREDKPVVAGVWSMLVWFAILMASSVILAGGRSVEGYASFGLVALVFGGSILTYRLRGFWGKTRTLLSTGQTLQPFDYKTQYRQGIYVLVALLFFFFLPFLLAGVLDTYAWLGSVAGGIDGWLLSLIAFNLYLGRWERAHGGKLYTSRVWRGTKVAQTGLRFDRQEGTA